MGSSSSMLTQYDIEEVQEHCHYLCNLFSSLPGILKIESLLLIFFWYFPVNQQEIVSLYKRFCQLDRSAKGFISADEFLSIPEFSVNPLSQRLAKMVDGLNFKEFVAFLSAFSSQATIEQKIQLIFKLYDTENRGKVGFKNLLEVLRDLTGSFMTEEQREQVLDHLFKEAGYTRNYSLLLDDFSKILGKSGLKMEVEVPVD